jgi:hypothetical protein
MNFLRGIVVKTRRDRIRNTHVGGGGLKMEEIQNQMKRSRLRWFGHIKKEWMSIEYQDDYWK